jgi:peptidoglycan/xylan/chitin deacetylase (PgdA/CDA1 family)
MIEQFVFQSLGFPPAVFGMRSALHFNTQQAFGAVRLSILHDMASSTMRVHFTVDTETSMGGAWSNSAYTPLPLDRTVFGKLGSDSYGIPLIMSILEEHGFRATFFTEVFCTYNVGHEPVATALRTIQSRGHDAQLHIHPEQRFYREFVNGGKRREESLIHTFPAAEQRDLIRLGIELFRELSGKRPRVFRAGCYGASEVTLKALRENGIEIDSSYNMAYLGNTCGFEKKKLNAPAIVEEIKEFPVTVFRVSGFPGYKPLEVSAVSVTEIMGTIRLLQEAGCRDVVLVLHSFSLLKNGGVRYEHCRPDHLVIRRLKKLCGMLSELHGEVEVGVLGEAPSSLPSVAQPQVIPSLSWLQPSLRKAVQGVNRLPWF